MLSSFKFEVLFQKIFFVRLKFNIIEVLKQFRYYLRDEPNSFNKTFFGTPV